MSFAPLNVALIFRTWLNQAEKSSSYLRRLAYQNHKDINLSAWMATYKTFRVILKL